MIQRDGASVSVWQPGSEDYKPINKFEDITYDAIIVGGGIAGISTALQLQNAGLKCLVLEAQTLCFGTTGGTTAHLNTLLDTPYTTIIKNFGEENAKRVANAAKDAIELIKNNIATYNIDCDFETASAFLFSQDKKQTKELENIFDSCQKVGLNINYCTDIPVSLTFEKSVEVKDQAKFNPVKYVYGLAHAFEEKGGAIVQQCRVLKHVKRHDEVSLAEIIEIEISPDKSFFCKALIYATHIPTGVNILHMRCAPYRSYAMAVKLSGDNYPADLSYDMYDPYHYYRTQKIDNGQYLIAGGEDHKTAHETNTYKCFNTLESHIRKHFDVEEIKYKWSSQYYEPTDGLPYIGNMPEDIDNVYVATGFGGNGMTYSHVAALILTDLLANNKKRYDDLFNPSRIKPIAGFKNFVKENADVAKYLLKKIFTPVDEESFSALAKGEAKIIEYEKKKIAIQKDSNGNLHAVNPTCTHLKCQVVWNDVEQSWDCPCHGARYDNEGNVLNAPADKVLEQVSIIKTILQKTIKQ